MTERGEENASAAGFGAGGIAFNTATVHFGKQLVAKTDGEKRKVLVDDFIH